MSDVTLLNGLVHSLNKDAKDCLVVDVRVAWPTKNVIRKIVVYRRSGVVRIVPDTLGNSTTKEVRESASIFDKLDVMKIIAGITGRETSLIRTEIKPINDPIVVPILRKLPKDQQTCIEE